MTTHLAIATEGLSPSVFTHKLFAKLGFGYSVEIIVTPIPISGGGGWEGDHYDITFIITWNGRIIKRSYRNIIFDSLVNIIISLKNISISTKYVGTKVLNTIFGTKLNSVKHTPVDFNVTEKPTNISIKRKLK